MIAYETTAYTNLFNQINGSFQIHTKVNEVPVDSFFLVLFLFKNEHVMVEELLQFLVGQVDTKLIKRVVLKEDKQYSDKKLFSY